MRSVSVRNACNRPRSTAVNVTLELQTFRNPVKYVHELCGTLVQAVQWLKWAGHGGVMGGKFGTF